MKTALPEFSSSQWAFLALLEACAEPVSMDLAGRLTPILPGEFLDLLARCERLGWLQKDGTQVLRLVRELPQEVRNKIQEINTQEQVLSFIERMEILALSGETDRVIMANLLSRCGRHKEAAFLETDLARQALAKSEFDASRTYLDRALARLEPGSGDAETDALYVSNVLLLSKHYFTLGTELEAFPSLLQAAENRAERMGDRRSCALIKLHRGRFLRFAGKRWESLSSLSEGLEEVSRINDIDLETESAEFLGVYFYNQGLYKEALDHFERAREAFEAQATGETISPMSIVYFGLGAAYTGQHERSVGIFDYYWRLFREKPDRSLACIMRAHLGIVLLMIKKNDEASFHLHQALEEAEKMNSRVGLYVGSGALSYLHYLEGREREAYELMTQGFHQMVESGIRHYTSPFVLEMLFAFDVLGFEPIPGFAFESEIEQIHNEPNIHLRGVALRLQAKQGFAKGMDGALLRSYLEKSEEYLKRSGDPTELAKTRLEMARLSLGQGDTARARSLAQQSRQGLSGYLEEFFPDDLRNLLETPSSFSEYKSGRDYLFKRFLDLIDGLVPHSNPELTLTRIVAATNRFLAAERGGLFWFDERKSKNVRLRVGCNLKSSDTSQKDFRSSLALIRKTFRTNQALLVRLEEAQGGASKPRAILCIPVGLGGQVQGVLYHENSYVNDCFDDVDSSQLVQLASHLSNHVYSLLAFTRQAEEKSRLLLRESIVFDRPDDMEFMAKSRLMIGLLGQADRMAASEAPVLISGETGVGKELLAHRLHKVSPRHERPFVIVDATTIPEALVETELFGHEKGAFTGADQKKIGRLTLAHLGTLFIDEIGELPLGIQAKLLRALQEKTFTPLGANKTQAADFRLIAATNRDLAGEVAAGRFRRDLYYRVNVMSVTIPPLRDRPEDVIMLAEHFLSFFARKHKRPAHPLTSQDKDRLISYGWPGNARELKNVMERSVILSDERRFDLNLSRDAGSDLSHPFVDMPSMEEMQRRYINYLLEKTQGRVTEAAELLGMNRTTLYSRMRKLAMTSK